MDLALNNLCNWIADRPWRIAVLLCACIVIAGTLS